MRKKILSATIIMALTAMMFAGCTPEAAEAEVTYKVVGGISEPTRVWNEVAEAPAEAAIEEEEVPTEEVAPAECPGAPEYTPTEPEVADTGCAGRYIVKEPNEKLSFVAYAGDSEKFDVIRELAGGEFVQVTGKTTKGWYALSDGSYIHSYVAEYSPEPKPQVVQTQPQTQTAPAESQPTQQEQSQPTQEQTYTEPAQQETQVAETPAEETQPAVVAEEVEDTSRSTTHEAWEQHLAEMEAWEEASRNCSHPSSHQELHESMGETFWVTICDNCGCVL